MEVDWGFSSRDPTDDSEAANKQQMLRCGSLQTRAMRLMWRAHVRVAVRVLVCAAPVYLFLPLKPPLPGPPLRFSREGAAPPQIKAAAGDQLEAIRCGRVAVEGGRSLGGDAAWVGRETASRVFAARNDTTSRLVVTGERKQVISAHPITASVHVI